MSEKTPSSESKKFTRPVAESHHSLPKTNSQAVPQEVLNTEELEKEVDFSESSNLFLNLHVVKRGWEDKKKEARGGNGREVEKREVEQREVEMEKLNQWKGLAS